MKTIKGNLKVIAKTGGIKLDDADKWYNIDNSLKEEFNIIGLEALKNKDVCVELNDKGYWLSITPDKIEFQESSKIQEIKQYKKVEIIKGSYDYVEKEINEFNKTHEVTHTQTSVIDKDNMMAVLFYKVEE